MKPIAVYVRISTDDQNTEGQTEELKNWLNRNAFNVDQVEWFEDVVSGKTLKRPAFNCLQSGIAKGEITTVICYKLDRISRSLADGMMLVGEWTKKGVRVISITQAIDMSGVFGQMMAAVLFGFAQIELEYRKERQRAGIKIAIKKGRYKGRRQGTTKGKPERAAALKAKGLQIEEIAKSLGTSIRTVHRYLNLNEAA